MTEASSQSTVASPGATTSGHAGDAHSIHLETVLEMFHPYYKGPKPRAGTRLRPPAGSTRPAVILGVDQRSRAICAPETIEPCGVSRAFVEDLPVDRRLPKASLRQVLECAIAWCREKGTPHEVFYLLIGHFNGVNGVQFFNSFALAWAMAANGRTCGHLRVIGLRRWASNMVADVRMMNLDPAEHLPPELLEIAAAPDAMATDPLWPKGDVDDALDRMLMYAHAEMAALDDVDSVSAQSVEPFTVASDVETDGEVIVLGPSRKEHDAGWADVIDVDELRVYPCHLDDLDLWEEREEARTVELMLWASATDNHDRLALLHLLTFGHDGSSVGMFRHLLLAGAIFRSAPRQTAVQRTAHRAMLAAYKTLPAEYRQRAVALLPELVNARSKQSHQPMAAPEALLPTLLQVNTEYMRAMRLVASTNTSDLAPPPAALGIEDDSAPALVASDDAPVDVGAELVLLERRASEDPAPDPALPEITDAPGDVMPAAAPAPLPRPKPRQIRLAPAPEPLRFKIAEYPLLAMEWALPPTPEAFQEAVATTLAWLSRRIGLTLPAHWNAGGHEIEHNGVKLDLEAGQALFALRLEHPDTQLATRTWRLEATVLAGAGGVGGMVGLRLSAQDRVESPAPTASVPGLVRAWNDSPGLVVADGLAREWQRLTTAEEYAQLQPVLEDLARDGLVWVIADGTDWQIPPPTHGLGRVVELAGDALAAHQRRFYSIARNTLQQFIPTTAVPVMMDLTAASTVPRLISMAIKYRQRPDTPSFREVRNLIRDAASRRPPPVLSPSVVEPTPTPATIPDPEPPSIAPTRLAYHDLQELLDLAVGEKETMQAERDSALNDMALLEEELRAARTKLIALQYSAGKPGRASSAPAPASTPIPSTLEDVESWALANLPPRVIIADKALRSAAKVEHREVSKIYAILLALRDLYWPMRWEPSDAARERWLQFLTANRLRCGPIGAAIDNDRYVDAYQAQFGKRTITMSLHVQGSSSRDPLRCIRVYFAPLDEQQQILVGSFPGHLDSTHS